MKFCDKEIKDIYAYTNCLSESKPNDVVDFGVKRGNEMLIIPITLGTKGAAH
jgi:cephalosporin hydroxylase